jgi:hypothetical protein
MDRLKSELLRWLWAVLICAAIVAAMGLGGTIE